MYVPADFCDSWTQTQTGNDADSQPKAKKQQKKQPSNVKLLTEQTEGGANSSTDIEEPLCSDILTINSHNWL